MSKKLRIACLGLAVGGLLGGVNVGRGVDLGSSGGYWSETRNFALTNTPIVDLNAVDQSLTLGFYTTFALLSLDVSHDATGKLHGYAQMQFIELVHTTNQVAPGFTTNIIASLFGPIAGFVSGPVGRQKVSLSARAVGHAVSPSGTGQTSASATLSILGKLEQGMVIFAANCKLVAKSQDLQTTTTTTTTITVSNQEWEPVYLSNTLMITSSLLPTKFSGTDAKGNMRCTGQAVISTAAEHSMYGSTVQTWNQSRNSLEEVANFNGTGVERGSSLRWKASRNLDEPRGGAIVTGKLLGQNFSQAVFFDWP